MEPLFDLKALALNAYVAYGRVTDYKNFRGEPILTFYELPPKIREAWEAAAESVAESVVDDVMNRTDSDRP